jgi:DNA polymerase III delta prime subunit
MDHHAFLFYGDISTVAFLPPEVQRPSLDVTYVEKDVLAIDDVRGLIDEASRTPFEAEYRTCVVLVRDIAYEAQQALLKILEEPPQHARFYFIVAPTTALLPTLQSRFALSTQSTVEEATTAVFSQFLKSSIADRLTHIAERTKEKDMVWVQSILEGMEQYAHKTKKPTLLRAVIETRIAAKSRGASFKMLLEDLALRLEEK